MHIHRREQALVNSAKAVSKHLPPSWNTLSPFLKSSTGLWFLFLVLALVRTSFYHYQRSKKFRAISKDVKRNKRKGGPLFWMSEKSKHVKDVLVKYRPPELTMATYVRLPRFAAGVVVCILYVIETYTRGVPTFFYLFQLVYGIFVLINFIVSFIYAERPLYFAFNITTICECLSIPSLMFASGSVWLNLTFLQAYCILVDWHQLEKHDIVVKNRTTLTRLLVNLSFQFLTFLYVTSCGVQLFETMGDWSEDLKSETFIWTWANAMYFAVVTLMTVGYGDFAPYTFFGRMWIIIHIIVAAFIVTREISLLVDAMQSMRRGNGSYVSSPSTSHVVVTGRVKWKFLQPFVIEFLEKTRNLTTKVIVLTPDPNWSEEDWFKFVDNDPFLDYHMLYLEGSPLNIEDLYRADITNASAAFVLADPHRQDPYTEDSDILKTVLSIRNVCGSVPIYCLNTLAESSFQFGFAMAPTEPLNGLDYTGIITTISSRHLLQSQGQGINRNHFSPRASISSPPNLTSPQSDHSGRNGSNNILAPKPLDFYSKEEEEVSSDTHRDEAMESNILDPHAPVGPNSVKAYRRSENLCMQELETVLLAENVFCNGLSTLIGNATAQVAHESRERVAPWLIEYRMGANCNVQYFTIPKQLDGKTYGSVAIILYDFGIIPIAIWADGDSQWVEDGRWTMLESSTVLEADKGSMALTYHDQERIQSFAEIAAGIVEKKEISPDTSASTKGEELVSRDMAGPSHSLERTLHPFYSTGEILNSDTPHASNPEIEAAEQFLNTTEDERSHWSAMESADMSHARSQLMLYLDSMQPRDVTAQIAAQRGTSTPILALDQSDNGDNSGLNNANVTESGIFDDDNEQGYVSSSQQRSSMQAKRKSHISRSHSASAARMKAAEKQAEKPEGKEDAKLNKSSTDITPAKREKSIYMPVDKLPAALRGHVIICLDGKSCLINLDLLLRQIWRKRAKQNKRVPVVVIHPRFPKGFSKRLGGNVDELFLLQGNSLAEETLKQAQYTSARAVLIMACETDDTENSSTDSRAIFTVMKLDSLLLEKDTFVCCILDDEESLELLRAPRQSRRVGVNLGEQREPHIFNFEQPGSYPKRSISVNSLKSQTQRSSYLATYGSINGLLNSTGALDHSTGRMPSSALPRSNVTGLTTSHSMRFDMNSGSDYAGESDKEMSVTKQRTQLKAREERYERQRYASGELMISSLFIALLAREYTQPGYIKLIRQLIGAFSESEGSWIRQVEIPEAWTRGFNINEKTYRETCLKLLEMGCLCLGLYRSGNGKVREEYACDRWERTVQEVVYKEDQPLLDETNDDELDPYSNLDRNFDDPSVYFCPTTKRKMYFNEHMVGENSLPYVFCYPPPYALVTDSDAVFVLCNPETEIPKNWD